MISDQVPKLIGDQFDRPSNVHGKTGLEIKIILLWTKAAVQCLVLRLKLSIVFSVTVAQRIRATVNEREQKQLLMDLDVVMRSNECPYIVKFYGALFKEVCFFRCQFVCARFRRL